MHEIKIPEWALERSVSFPNIDPKKTALLVVDLQNVFVDPAGSAFIPMALSIVPRVNKLIAAFRGAGSHVIFVRHTVSDDPRFAVKEWQRHRGNAPSVPADRLRAGHPEHDLHPSLAREPGDIIVDKHRYSAMPDNSSDMHSILSGLGIDTLVICGAATNVCCETTARDAAMLDYRIFFASDATATFNDELHNASLLNLAIIFADVRLADEISALLPQTGDAVPYANE